MLCFVGMMIAVGVGVCILAGITLFVNAGRRVILGFVSGQALQVCLRAGLVQVAAMGIQQNGKGHIHHFQGQVP